MRKELIALRHAMEQSGVDVYVIPTDDFHGSEYVGDYFRCRAYVSGFTGSAGTLVVAKDWAGLWTDGRYSFREHSSSAAPALTCAKWVSPGFPRCWAG